MKLFHYQQTWNFHFNPNLLMAVLFITHKYPPSTGGMENQSFQLIRGYCLTNESYSIIYNGKESLPIFFIKLRYRVHKILNSHPEIHSIHLNDGLMASFFILLCVDAKGRKKIVTLHGLDVVFSLSLYQRKILPLLANTMDVFICVSKATMDECVIRNFPLEKLFVVNNGVNHATLFDAKVEDFVISGINFEKDKILLAIGRPVKRKGFSWFANEVMPLLSDEYKFLHIGNINLKVPFFYPLLPKRTKRLYDQFTGRADDTESLIKYAKITSNRTILAGKLTDRQRDFCIQKASFLVMPNLRQSGDMEGFGLVVLEASVLGKIVLAADIEGIKDAIKNNKNGYLLPTADPKSWAKKINELGQIQTPTNAFREFTMHHYSWSKMVTSYTKIFQEFEQ